MSETMFHELPILDVHKENIEEAWPIIISAINGATFVGLDAELSGLGRRLIGLVDDWIRFLNWGIKCVD